MESAADAEAELKARCDTLWKELNEIQAQLNQNEVLQASTTSPPTELSVLQERLRQMQAEIDIQTAELQSQEPALPTNPVLLREIVKHELSLDIRQLEQLRSILHANIEQLHQNISSGKVVQNRLQQLRGELERRVDIELLQANNHSEDLQQQLTGELLADNKVLKKLFVTRLRQMRNFIDKHFPPPTQAQVRDWIKKYGSSASETPSAGSLKPLQNMLEILMNACIETPNDAYVTLDDTYWPPYVEMLLRSGVIKRHPERADRVQLTAYHL